MGTMLSPAEIPFVISTRLPWRDVYSTITTASAPGRCRRAGHDSRALARFQPDGSFGRRSGFDLSNHLERGGNLNEVSGSHGIAVARGSREGRKIAVGSYWLSQDLSGTLKQVDEFFAPRAQAGSVLLDQVARFFECSKLTRVRAEQPCSR